MKACSVIPRVVDSFKRAAISASPALVVRTGVNATSGNRVGVGVGTNVIVGMCADVAVGGGARVAVCSVVGLSEG